MGKFQFQLQLGKMREVEPKSNQVGFLLEQNKKSDEAVCFLIFSVNINDQGA